MGPVPAWVANLPLWQWYQIPGTALSSVDPATKSLGITGPSAKIDAWCGAALKRKGSVYMIGAAGGHADYAGNEVDALQLNTEKPAWAQLRAPTPNSQIINATAVYLDRRPGATHTYSQSHYINASNRLVVFARDGVTGDFPAPPPDFPYVGESWSKSFDTTAGDWDPPEYIARFPGTGDTPGALCAKHPWTDDVYYSRNYGSGWYRWSSTSNTWTRLSGTSRSPWYAGGAIDPIRNQMLIVGGYSPIDPIVTDLNGNSIAVSFKGLGAAALRVVNYPGVIYDEALDKYIVVYNDGDTSIKVCTVDAATWEVADGGMSGVPPAVRKNGIHNSVQYVPELKGFVIATKHTGDVYFVRTST
jgi:hypothetical protein